jgi:SAM-dependent methyltransferase
VLSFRTMSPESRRFQTAAAHYLLGRPAYPAAFIEKVASLCGLNRSHRILDLGCGPAPLAVAFAPFVGSVLAVDPEPEMLRVAREAVRAAGVAVEVREGSSETIGPEWGRFQAVTMGRSFHWMDRAKTLERLDALVDRDGAVILFNDEVAETPENGPLQAWRAVVERYSADDTVRAQRRSPEWQDHEAVLVSSPFSRIDRVVYLHRGVTTVDILVHRALSMSATTRSRLGDRADQLVSELRAVLAPLTADGTLTEQIEWTAIVARRP